mgnify:CR=1 FL=1
MDPLVYALMFFMLMGIVPIVYVLVQRHKMRHRSSH